MKPPTITLDKANNTITMTAKGKSLSISEGAFYTDTPPIQLENLVHSILTVVATALVAAYYMMLFAVIFGGRYLDEIKRSIEKGKANVTRN